MASEGELPFDPAQAKEAMAQLMKTPEGREIAEKIKAKLRSLDLQFQGLKEGDKKEFMKNFKTKFADSFEDLRDSLKKNLIDNDQEDGLSGDSGLPTSSGSTEFNPLRSVAQPDYRLFILAFLIVVVLFG